MPTLSEHGDATRNKIDEAEYFLHQIKDRRDAYLSGQYDNEICLRLFTYHLSAFLCSARSILDYMKMQYKLGDVYEKKFRSNSKYMQKDGKFKELKFFDEIRVENVHYKFGNKEPYKIKQRDQVNLCLGAYICLESSELLTGSDESRSDSTQPLQQNMQYSPSSTKEDLVSQRIPIELLFLKQAGFLDKDTEVIEFCTRQLKTMIELVELCEKGKFTEKELDSFPSTS